MIVGGWVQHMPKDGLSWWERVERPRCLESRTLPRFGALLGDNTPSPALRGLRMITMAQVIQRCSLSCMLEVGEGKASSLLSLWVGLVLTGFEPFAWVPWGGFI